MNERMLEYSLYRAVQSGYEKLSLSELKAEKIRLEAFTPKGLIEELVRSGLLEKVKKEFERRNV